MRMFQAYHGLWLVLCGVWLVPSAQAAAGTKPPRIALVIGHNLGQPRLKPLRFAQRDASRVARLLRELGGFRASQIHLLLAPSRTRLRETMKAIARRLRKAGGQGTFLLYYSGHALSQHFLLRRERLAFREMTAFVKKLPVRVRLMIVDSCYSGSLIRKKGQGARAKGASRRAFVRWTPHEFRLQTKGLAILTSSGAREQSYESNQIRSSFFTSSLLAGLRGAADSNRDQRVSLAEIRHYVYARTIAHAARHRVTVQRPAHRIQLRGQGPLFLTYLKRAQARVTFASPLQGHFFIYHNTELVHEFEKPKGKPLTIGLRSGAYQIHLRWKGWLGVAHATVRQRQRRRIAQAQLQWRQLSVREQVKGGDKAFSTGLGLLLHYVPISNVSTNAGGLSLALDSRRWMSLSLRYQYAASNLRNLPHHTHDVALRINLGYGLGLSDFWCWFGGFMEPRLTWRTFSAHLFINAGFAAGATVHFDYFLSPRWAMRLQLAGGMHLILFDQDTRVAPFFDLGMGLILRL